MEKTIIISKEGKRFERSCMDIMQKTPLVHNRLLLSEYIHIHEPKHEYIVFRYRRVCSQTHIHTYIHIQGFFHP
jgi:hypothetical protein